MPQNHTNMKSTLVRVTAPNHYLSQFWLKQHQVITWTNYEQVYVTVWRHKTKVN